MTKNMFIRCECFLKLLGKKGFLSYGDFSKAHPGAISSSTFSYWLAGKYGRPWAATINKIDKVAQCLGCEREDFATDVEFALNTSEVHLKGRWRLVVTQLTRVEHEGHFELIGSRLTFRASPGYKLWMEGFVIAVSNTTVSGYIRVDERDETNVVNMNFSGDVYESTLTGKGIGRTKDNQLVVVDFEGTKFPQNEARKIHNCKPR